MKFQVLLELDDSVNEVKVAAILSRVAKEIIELGLPDQGSAGSTKQIRFPLPKPSASNCEHVGIYRYKYGPRTYPVRPEHHRPKVRVTKPTQ